MPSKYKLTYLNLRARAEVARFLFEVAGVEYEDVRLDWPYSEDWPSQKQKFPNGQVPVLEIDGQMYSQSYAMQRYLAKQFGVAGKTPLDELRADMIVDTVEDMIKPLLPIHYTQDQDEKTRIRTTYIEDKLPQAMQNLEKMLIENKDGDGFFVGDELTWADLDFVGITEWIECHCTIDWPKYPKLAALRDKVYKIPQIAAWIEKRPKTPL